MNVPSSVRDDAAPSASHDDLEINEAMQSFFFPDHDTNQRKASLSAPLRRAGGKKLIPPDIQPFETFHCKLLLFMIGPVLTYRNKSFLYRIVVFNDKLTQRGFLSAEEVPMGRTTLFSFFPTSKTTTTPSWRSKTSRLAP